MADLHPPEPHLNGAGADRLGGGPTILTSSETVGSKRQRRPSVRLGEIGGGDHFYETHPRRNSGNKPWKHHQFDPKKDPNASKSSKTRALTNLATGGEFVETLNEEGNLDSVAIGSWKVKDSKKRVSNGGATKRVRSNWVSKMDDAGGGGEEKYSGGEDMDETYRDFDMENSEQSPVHSLENLGDGNERNEREMYYNRMGRGRSNHNHDGVELSGPSDTDVRDYRNNGRCGVGEDGVRIWLNSIGLGRYAPVFEVHEVDDEVLPMLTLEDLKDMGINAVGSRRKMFCAIQKLGKGFS
ncbi:Sterile alpha motif (SAM) domain-containing protein [Euphorbia peplus]|nr:Sterile alpha motif (SAM) domain-containing protein [Euphorbia peplus]